MPGRWGRIEGGRVRSLDPGFRRGKNRVRPSRCRHEWQLQKCISTGPKRGDHLKWRGPEHRELSIADREPDPMARTEGPGREMQFDRQTLGLAGDHALRREPGF